MLTSVTFENYRGFKHYTVGGLSRVNLLVGKNNSGKTAVLEGLQFLLSGGNPGVLYDIAARRGEVIETIHHLPDSGNAFTIHYYPLMNHFFHGHELILGQAFCIFSNTNDRTITVSLSSSKDYPKQLLVSPIESSDTTTYILNISVRDNETNNVEFTTLIPLTKDGAAIRYRVLDEMQLSIEKFHQNFSPNDSIIGFISPESLRDKSLIDHWGSVTSKGQESEIITALNIIEPRLTDIRFQPAKVRSEEYPNFLLEFEGRSSERVPLGSFGDGMRRMLALAASMVQCSNGYLLIDEIDTGLHHSIMGDMWRLVLETARSSNIQVFATTHSLDCLKGLAWLCEKYPEYGEDISLQRIQTGLDESVSFSAGEISAAIQGELEIR